MKRSPAPGNVTNSDPTYRIEDGCGIKRISPGGVDLGCKLDNGGPGTSMAQSIFPHLARDLIPIVGCGSSLQIVIAHHDAHLHSDCDADFYPCRCETPISPNSLSWDALFGRPPLMPSSLKSARAGRFRTTSAVFSQTPAGSAAPSSAQGALATSRYIRPRGGGEEFQRIDDGLPRTTRESAELRSSP